MENTNTLLSSFGSQMMFISSSPDTMLLWLTVWAAQNMPALFPHFEGNKIKINLCLKNTVSPYCNLNQRVHDETTAIVKKVKNLDIPYFSITSSENEADIVIIFSKTRAKIAGKKKMVLLIKWRASVLSEQYWEKLPEVQEKYGEIVSLKDLKTQPISSTKESAAILRVNGFLRECAYLLIIKTALSAA